MINKEGAETVRKIYQRYREIGSVGKLKEVLTNEKICSRVRKNSDGTVSGGRPFSRGALHHLLRNRIYIGETVHKGCSYQGQHEPIVTVKIWEQVAKGLKQNDQAHRSTGPTSTPSLLAGRLFDVNGARFTPTHAVKKGKRYRYYTSQAAISKTEQKPPIVRVPAHPLEQVVTSRLHQLIKNPDQFLAGELSDMDKERITAAAKRFTDNCKSTEISHYRELVRAVVKKVTLGEANAWILVSTKSLIEKLLEKTSHSEIFMFSDTKDVTLTAEFRTHRSAGVLQLISPQIEKKEKLPLPSFFHMVARARIWYERIVSSEVQSIEALAKEVKMTPRSTRRVLRWATLSPKLIEAMVKGNFRPNLTSKRYLREFPLDWQNQEAFLLGTNLKDRPSHLTLLR